MIFGLDSAGVERGVQSSLPSLTYEALKALGQDIEAFRQMQRIQGQFFKFDFRKMEYFF